MNRPLRNDAVHLDAVAAAYIQMVKDGERPSPRAIHERLGRRESYSAVEHNLRRIENMVEAMPEGRQLRQLELLVSWMQKRRRGGSRAIAA